MRREGGREKSGRKKETYVGMVLVTHGLNFFR